MALREIVQIQKLYIAVLADRGEIDDYGPWAYKLHKSVGVLRGDQHTKFRLILG